MTKSVIFLPVVFTAATLFAQSAPVPQPPANPPALDCNVSDQCTIMQTIAAYRIVKKVQADTVNANRPQAAPDSFAGRVHNSYQDFLNLFAFAINKVEESKDGQALIVRFNPLREGSNLLGFTATAAKPSISEDLQNAIPQTSRTTNVAALQKKLGDLDDLTLSGSYSFATANCSISLDPQTRCWGRSPEAYRDILFNALAPMVDTFVTQNQGQLALMANVQEITSEMKDFGSFKNTKLSDTKNPARVREVAKGIARNEASITSAEKQFFADKHFDLVSALLDNQPQLALTSNYHTPGHFGGPTDWSANLEFHVGTENLNSVRRECRQPNDGPCFARALGTRLANGVSTMKWVVTGTWKKTDRFAFDSLSVNDTPIPDFKPFKVNQTTDLSIKGQGGKLLDTKVNDKAMRVDVSAEFHRATKGGIRNTNRAVATLTLSVPFGDNMTIPFSLNYANKAEFLVDQKRRLGVHFGITYRLPMSPVAKNGL